MTVLAREPAAAAVPGSSSSTSAARPPTSTACPTPTPSRRPWAGRRWACPARRRTVEGDLGVSWSVEALRAAAVAEGLPVPGRRPARARRGRRHHRAAPAPAGRGGLRAGGASARAAGLVVLSGGVFRHADPAAVAPSSTGWPPTPAGRRACWPGRRSSSTAATCSPQPGCCRRAPRGGADAGCVRALAASPR